MKFFRQVVLPVAILLALIAGVTFVSFFTGNPSRPETTKVLVGRQLLRIHEEDGQRDGRAIWNPADPTYAREIEINQTGEYSFSFENQSQDTVDASLQFQSELLTAIDIGTIPRDKLGKRDKILPLSEAVTGKLTWQPLDLKGRKVTVPGGTLGAVRLRWRSSIPGRQWLQVVLDARQPGLGQPERHHLKAAVVFVPPVEVYPAEQQLPDLGPAQPNASTFFLVWSATRGSFTLTNNEADSQPCFQCTWKPLSEEDRQLLRKKHNTRVRSGYRVDVNVADRDTGAGRLDLGPYRRQLRLATDVMEPPVLLHVAGIVRGEVGILNPDDRDGVQLGKFQRQRGASKTVVVEAADSSLDLKLDSYPADWKVALTPKKSTGHNQWNLQIEVPANRYVGPLPEEAAIMLKIMGKTPRRFRIPVVGQAIQ